ncbi:MAG: family 16 glycoside hydrolase, partial [Thermocrispum sp.]
STEAGPVTHTYQTEGEFTAKLSVTDSTGLTGVASVVINAGNTAPTVELTTPVDGGFFGYGDTVPFQVTVTDPEDGEIDCSKVVVEYILGHDDHGHPLSRATGCDGTIESPADEGHGMDADVFGVINASYTDSGGLAGDGQNLLQPKLKQAEFFAEQNGTQVVNHAEASGGKRVGFIENGDWIAFDPVNLTGIDEIGYRVSSGGVGGTITVHAGALDGPVVQTVEVANTGGWDTYADIAPAPITDAGGTGPLYLVFSGGSGGLFDVDNIQAVGSGVADGGGDPAPKECEPTPPDDGYTSLFDGTEASLQGWSQAGPGSFAWQQDCTILSTGGMGLLSFGEEFNAYRLKLDWKVAGDDNSGIFVGYPEPGDDPWVAVNQGYEIQIDATDAPEKTTGAIYGFQSADIAARDEALNPPGVWNTYEIEVVGQTITVILNGVVINEFTSTDPARDLTQGYVGIQNHGDGDDASFRNIQIREIEDGTAPVTTAERTDDGALKLTATDEGQGVAKIQYAMDGGGWRTYGEPVSFSGEGEHRVRYRAIDKAGNKEKVRRTTITVHGTG